MKSKLYHRYYNSFRECVRSILSPQLYYYIRDKLLPGEVYCIYLLLKRKSSQSIMIDVGAHVGGSLIKFAQDGWIIFAFEPDNLNRSKLIELCKRAKLTNVNIDFRAISDKRQEKLSFFRSEVSSGISGLSAFDDSHKEIQKVKTTTLENFCKNNNIDKVDFLKIDTEGWDYFVLKGLPFEKITPRIILAEFEDHKTVPQGYTWKDMVNFLIDKGYTVAVSEWYPVIKYGGNHKWRDIKIYPCELIDKNATGNLIACKNEKDMQQIIQNIKKYLKGK